MKRSALLICIVLLPFSVSAGFAQVNGKWSEEKYIPTLSVQEHYDRGYQALYANDWDEALLNFKIVMTHFPDSPFYSDSIFYSGICHYFKADFDFANRQFDLYLTQSGKLKHFEKVFDFKYHIADYYQMGMKKHLFGISKLPKWAPAKSDSVELLDEIVAALPGKEIAAKALYKKAEILLKRRQYRESIDCLQTLGRRFPKHSLSADSYVKISEVYYAQALCESQNPDLISLAKVNIAKFGRSFPGDERIRLAEENLTAMEEVYARSLYETGRFYERKKKPHASAIYYQDAIQKYPGTVAARKSQERLDKTLAQR
ncbi:MAG: tetratricopeptide repeat protein [Chlamydiales bacterium]|nr:tetratricopeptide repeat protein [Chlamydiales bacterium]